MASSFLSLVLAFLFIINLSHASDLITEVCSRTQNPPLCNETLRSDPRAADADLEGLGRISIEISKAYAESTYKYAVSLSKEAGEDRKLKDRYDTCVENYDSAVYEMDEARKALDSGDIDTFRTKASAALDGPVTCEDSFEGPPSATLKLQKANKKSEGLVSIVLAIGAILDGE